MKDLVRGRIIVRRENATELSSRENSDSLGLQLLYRRVWQSRIELKYYSVAYFDHR